MQHHHWMSFPDFLAFCSRFPVRLTARHILYRISPLLRPPYPPSIISGSRSRPQDRSSSWKTLAERVFLRLTVGFTASILLSYGRTDLQHVPAADRE
jgi:hypothetical protein